MKDLTYLNKFRVKIPEVCLKGEGVVDLKYNGAFAFRVEGVELHVIAGRGKGWDHISVSCRDRCPTWNEMDKMKRIFFDDSEVAMQLHVPVKDHINLHPFTLHIWRPISKRKPIPLPPKDLV
jgi:hypothetical protein